MKLGSRWKRYERIYTLIRTDTSKWLKDYCAINGHIPMLNEYWEEGTVGLCDLERDRYDVDHRHNPFWSTFRPKDPTNITEEEWKEFIGCTKLTPIDEMCAPKPKPEPKVVLSPVLRKGWDNIAGSKATHPWSYLRSDGIICRWTGVFWTFAGANFGSDLLPPLEEIDRVMPLQG